MFNERFGFLPLESGGAVAMIVGGVPPCLIEYAAERFRRLILVDWDARRLEETGRRTIPESSVVTTAVIEPGRPEFPAEDVNLALTLWSHGYLGDAARWTTELTERLKPRGKLVIIEQTERPTLPGQQLTRDLIRLRLELDAATGKPVQPAGDAERLSQQIPPGALSHIRQRTFTDPDLLAESGFWRREAERLICQVEEWKPKPASSIHKELHRQALELRSRLAQLDPSTPPFAMLTAVRRSRAASLEARPEPEESLGEDTSANIYISRTANAADPLEGLLMGGPGSLKNQELLRIALSDRSNGDQRILDPEQLSRRIITEYGNKAISEERNPGRMADMLGISLATACQVVAIFELGRRFFEEPTSRDPVIRSPEDAYQYLRDMGSLKKEHLRGLYLNVQSRMIHDEVISIGTLSRSVVHPREVFAPALDHAANSVILAHNHPSGDLTPSDTDVIITRQLAQAGRIMGIELLDHLIIGSSGFISLKKKGVI